MNDTERLLVKMIMKPTQIVKVNTSIIDFFYVSNDLDNAQERKETVQQFIDELTKALNCGNTNKEIVWVQNPTGIKFNFAE